MSAQLTLFGQPPFCPAVHCHVPCGVGLGVTCTCRPHRCRYCRTARDRRPRLTADVLFRGPLPRPLFPHRSPTTKGATR